MVLRYLVQPRVCITIRHRTHRRYGTGVASTKLEPHDLIVCTHRYRRDGTHRRDRTGGAEKDK